MSNNSLPMEEGTKDSVSVLCDSTKKPDPSNESCNSNSDGGSIGSGISETRFGLSLNIKPRGLLVHEAIHAGRRPKIMASQKPLKKKQGTCAAKHKYGTKSRRTSLFKADKKQLPHLSDPYFNFLRAFRMQNRKEPEDGSIVRKAAFFWDDLNLKQRSLFESESLSKGVSALSILNHLEYWKAKLKQQTSDVDSIRTDNDDDDIANTDSCCPKKRKSCARKKRSCPRRKKRRSCRKKKPSCRRKRRSCKPKKRSCRRKKRACRPKPKCRPKRRC